MEGVMISNSRGVHGGHTKSGTSAMAAMAGRQMSDCAHIVSALFKPAVRVISAIHCGSSEIS